MLCSHLNPSISLGVQEVGDSFPKTLATEIKQIIPNQYETKSKIFDTWGCYQ